MIERGTPLPICDLIVLAGSKATIADLAVLRAEGWDIDIAAHARRGGHVLGFCGGYQMLGQTIADPRGIEGAKESAPGLGLLDIHTVIAGQKTLAAVTGTTVADAAPVKGYEMHMGVSTGPDTTRPLLRLRDERADGAISTNGRVAGTYVHGFFADDAQRRAWVERLGGMPSRYSHDAEIESTLDALAVHLEAHIDIDHLVRLAR
jgi:adenosylcobyric acid synthase